MPSMDILSEHPDHYLAKNEEDRLLSVTLGLVNREIPGVGRYSSLASRTEFRSAWRLSVLKRAEERGW